MAKSLMLKNINGFDNWLKNEYEQGKSGRELAAECCCTYEAIMQHLRRIGVKLRKKYVPQRRSLGDKCSAGEGYIAIYCPYHPSASNSGFVHEHRLVMEKIIGRRLKSEEVVHHINGNRADNRPENLKLYSNSGEHSKEHFGKTVNIVDINGNKFTFISRQEANIFLGRCGTYLNTMTRNKRRITDKFGLQYFILENE